MADAHHFYLTTTLPYVNGEPHIGHTLEFIQADVIARYQRLMGREVYFNTGTDEHGLKVFRKAAEQGKTPQEMTDFYAQRFKDFCETFQISYDRFIRTTEPEHYQAAQQFWQQCLDRRDIYEKEYSGLYDVTNEVFVQEKDLVDGRIAATGKEPEMHSEKNYFFRFSKYQQPLLDLYSSRPDFIQPLHKQQEMVEFVSRGLEDFSISRRKENLPWGVPVPGDPDQVMYVWFDALVNYITTIGYGSDEQQFVQWWPVVQLCGPDNNRFQSAMWQAMLMSAGLEPSDKILVHGMVLAEDGVKMSKSLGNVVSPFDLTEKYSIDAIRYYLVAGMSTFQDAPFSFTQLEAKYESELMHNFGNLLNRVITLIARKGVKINSEQIDSTVHLEVEAKMKAYQEHMQQYEMQSALEQVERLGAFGNQYITEREPWNKKRSAEEVSQTLNSLYFLLEKMVWAYAPVMPKSCEIAERALKKLESVILFQPLEVSAWPATRTIV